MKLPFTFLLLTHLLQAQVWNQLYDYPGARRDDGVGVIVNNKAYFGTGLIEWSATIDFFSLDVSDYSWKPISTMPATTERQYACAFPGTNCFYVFGGDGNGVALNTMYKYDIDSDTWSPVASKPGNGLIAAACMSFGDKVIISGGRFQSGKTSDEVWEYTISTDSWLQKNNYPFAGRWRSGSAVLNGSGYLMFGIDTGGSYRKEMYKYSLPGDSWTKVMDFPLPLGRAYTSLNAVQSRLVLFGGVDTLNHHYKDTWYYNETTNSWLQGPDIPSDGRKGGLSCAANNRLFYTCGIKPGAGRITETWTTDIPLALNEQRFSPHDFFVYPNPTDGFIHFQFSGGSPALVSCRYSDVYGRELGRAEDIRREDLDLTHLKTGVYILKFYSENQLLEAKKIIKN